MNIDIKEDVMLKYILRALTYIFIVVLLTSTLQSCGHSNKKYTQYVAAKLVDSDKWSIVDVKTGKIIQKDEFRSQPSVIVNGKFCVINGSGLYDYFSIDNVSKPINSESFLYATSFNENDIALAVLRGKGISVINGKCEIVANLDNTITYACDFDNGYAAVLNDENKYGYINEKGEIVISPVYDRAYNFSVDGVAVVGKEINDSITKYFAIDDKGSELFSFMSTEYKDFGYFTNGYLPVQNYNDEVILLDKKGRKPKSIGTWKGFLPFWLGYNDGVIVFKEGNLYGLKGENNGIVIRAKYDLLIPLNEIDSRYYLAKKDGKYGVVDIKDKIVIPFEYSVLGYINKDVLYAGNSNSFGIVNKKLEDIGHNNYTNLSFMTGSEIYSNYFDADIEARKILSNITDSSFFKTNKDMLLFDFRDKLSGFKYAEMNESSLREDEPPYTFVYCFSNNLASQRYEYLYGYPIATTVEYNYHTPLARVLAINEKFKEFQPGSEEALGEAFDEQIHKIGFQKVNGRPNWFINEKNVGVALSYKHGVVTLMCAYNPIGMNVNAERISRNNSFDNNVKIDYEDAFGLEHSDNSIESDSAYIDVPLYDIN